MRVLKHIKALGLSLVMMTSLCLTSLIGSGGSVIASATPIGSNIMGTTLADDGIIFENMDVMNGNSHNFGTYDEVFPLEFNLELVVSNKNENETITKAKPFSIVFKIPESYKYDKFIGMGYLKNTSMGATNRFNASYSDSTREVTITAVNSDLDEWYEYSPTTTYPSYVSYGAPVDDGVNGFYYRITLYCEPKDGNMTDVSDYIKNDKIQFDGLETQINMNGNSKSFTTSSYNIYTRKTFASSGFDGQLVKSKEINNENQTVDYYGYIGVQNTDVLNSLSITTTFDNNYLSFENSMDNVGIRYASYDVGNLVNHNWDGTIGSRYIQYFDISTTDNTVTFTFKDDTDSLNYLRGYGITFILCFNYHKQQTFTQPIVMNNNVKIDVNGVTTSSDNTVLTAVSLSSVTNRLGNSSDKYKLNQYKNDVITSKGDVNFGGDFESSLKLTRSFSGDVGSVNFSSFKLFDESGSDVTSEYGNFTKLNYAFEYTFKPEKLIELHGKEFTYELTYNITNDNANRSTTNGSTIDKMILRTDSTDIESNTVTLYRSGVNAPTNSFDKSILENKQAEAIYTVSDIVDTKTEDYYYDSYELKGILDDNLQYKSAKVVDESNTDASAKFTVTQDGNGAKAVAKDVNNSDFYGHTYKLQITAGVKSENTLNSLQSDNGVVTLENAGQGTLTVNNADWTVNSNIQVKVVDKSRLETLVQQAQQKQEAEYTPQTWSPFNTELSEANGVLQNDDADQNTIDSAYSELESAMNSLVEKADKTQLQALVQQAVTKQQNDYTTATWTPFSSKLAAAQSVLQDDNASQTSVDNAKNELQSAMDGLVQRGNKEELRRLVEQGNAKQQKDYTPDTWSPFDAKLKAAQGVLDNVDATQGEVDTAKDNLKQAMDALREKADKSKLQDLVNQGNALNQNDYTKDSQSALEQALQSAQEVLDDDNAQNSQVEDEYNKLKKVIDGLEKKPDKSELQKAVERADALNPDDYTDDSKAGLDNAVKKAKEVLDDPDASKDDVDNALKDLNDALDKLTEKADKSELQKTVDKAHEINPDDYLSDSLPDFNEALEDAEGALADNNATQDDVDNAKNALEDAMSNLEKKPDKSDLKNLVDKAEMLDPDDYTDDSKSKLQNAIDNAKDVIDNEEATQEDVDSAKDKLQNALDSLEKKPDKTKLQNLVDEANELNPEEDNEDVQNFKDALENAQKVLDDPDATQQNIDDVYDRLKEAMDKLTGKEYTDKSELQDIIDRADKLDPDKYEDSSEFNEALKHAKNVLNDENATQQDIDDAVKRLQDAMDNLKLKNTDTDKNDNKDNKNTGAVATTTNNNNKDNSDKESELKALQPIEPLFVDDSGNQDYDNNVEMTPVEIPDTTQMIYSPDTGNKFMDYLPVAILLVVFAAGLVFVAIRIIKKREKNI